ncbi:YifB family Mg chelatase-like AAA ATPase [uncultured Jatrophihabitans sp.]|uniref:YifB family Mg chelatase-like AAA ATPase n=1 Tax=uncultured Jatrophihabitans sp. TaxID=1610747 RepID=UPI0035CB170D
MALARTRAVALTGVTGQLVEVECDISAGLPGLSFTGRADTSVVESRDRMRAAIVNSGAAWPNRKVTVALLPADVRKIGSRFDLAIAIAVLAAAEQVRADAVDGVVWIAELSLEGRLRPVRGVLPAALAAREHGARRIVVARENAAEACLVDGVDIRAADSLRDIVQWLTGEGPALEPVADQHGGSAAGEYGPDLLDVAGQQTAKRALEIAAAGGHNLMLVGSPGAGKTMLAERLPGLLPSLEDAAALEVTAVHSVAGLLDAQARLVRRPPLQAPHHTASAVALVGGGPHLARPGAISLAHHGVLFLDEASEFAPSTLDALRQPLETGHVVIHRGGGAVRYPARFQLVLAANPCPCARPGVQCICPSLVRRRHEQRLSGPLMDRIDLRVEVDPVSQSDFLDPLAKRDSSATVAQRVLEARARATRRWTGTPWRCNGDVPGAELRSARWLLGAPVLGGAYDALAKGTLTARGFDRVLRIAWTIADLAGTPQPSVEHVREALYYRTGRSQQWAA